jgi:hypothetical protein
MYVQIRWRDGVTAGWLKEAEEAKEAAVNKLQAKVGDAGPSRGP